MFWIERIRNYSLYTKNLQGDGMPVLSISQLLKNSLKNLVYDRRIVMYHAFPHRLKVSGVNAFTLCHFTLQNRIRNRQLRKTIPIRPYF